MKQGYTSQWEIILVVFDFAIDTFARIFVLGHHLFRDANSFPRAKLDENYEP